MANRQILPSIARIRPVVPQIRASSLAFAARYAQEANAEPRAQDTGNVGLSEVDAKSFKLRKYLVGKTMANASSSNSTARDAQRAESVLNDPNTVYVPRPPDLKHPEIQDNKIMVYSSTTGGFVQVPNIWLRDNCQCKTCVHEDTKQRLLDTWQIPKDISIESCEFVNASSDIRITWDDGHETIFSSEFLAKSALKSSGTIRQGLIDIKLWDASIKDREPVVSYSKVMKTEKGVLDWLRLIREHGFCYVDDTPFSVPKDTKKLLERIAFIRLTHYGGFYDFTADLASRDTAYTALALDAHTDNTYFSDPAGLQAFHLLSHDDGEGGASLLVDGFKVANDLLREDPKAYEVLSTVNLHGHASGNEGMSIQPYRGFPVLNHDPTTGFLVQVQWNSNDRGAIDLPIEKMEEWYAAAAKWVEILRRPENEYWRQLTPGRVLVFDNWRVMHGRSAFTGKRRICGAYINRDDWISRFKMLHFGKDKVLEAIPIGM